MRPLGTRPSSHGAEGEELRNPSEHKAWGRHHRLLQPWLKHVLGQTVSPLVECLLSYTEPWVQSTALHRSVIVAHNCDPSTQEVKAEGSGASSRAGETA